MPIKFENRSYNFEIRAEQTEENTGLIVGRPIVYDSRTDLGYFDEIIQSGALDGADLKDVRFLVNHDTSKIPLARSRNNNANSTMLLAVDREGMETRINLDIENNTEARNLYSAVNRGDVSGMSFMFGVEEDEWRDLDTDHPTRIIKKISRVVEVSAVTFPAYESTSISTRNKEALDSARATLDSVKKDKSLDSELQLEKLKLQNRMKGVF